MGTNNHGFHANRYCVNYEEVIDVPKNIMFKASPDVRYGVHTINEPSLTNEENKELIKDIYNGFQIEKHCSFKSIIMDRDTAFKFMKHKKNYRSFSFKVYNFDEFISFEIESIRNLKKTDEEEQLLDDIIGLQDIKDSESLLNRILLLSDSPFQRKALLLLKIKAFDIEDQHFLSEKKHSEEDLKNLKIFKKTNYIQR
ncbi:MAG: hypothetical protein IJG97_04355 [Bacilli bacterium]|nr:hypothetical protein [Bacilli bacterium]